MKTKTKEDKLRKIVDRLTRAYHLKRSYVSHFNGGRGCYGYKQNNKLYNKAYQELKELLNENL